MNTKFFTKIFYLIVLSLLLAVSCSEHKIINDNYIAQIDNLGIHKGVFERKFKRTDVYGKNKVFTSEMLKTSLNKILLNDHLLINDALNLGFDEDPMISKTILEYKLNLIASNHPIYTEDFSIPKEELLEFYSKKKFVYTFEIIQHNSLYLADTIYSYLLQGNELSISEDNKERIPYPRKIAFKNSTYGNDVPVEVYDIILEMNNGEVSSPIHSGPVWTIIKLIEKKKNNNLKKYDEMKNVIIQQIQPLKKSNQIKQLTEQLREKYKLQIDKQILEKIYKTFRSDYNEGSFDRGKIAESDLDETIISTTKEKFNVDFLIFMLNRSGIFRNVQKILIKELDIAINNIADMIVFYFDGLEKEVDKIELVNDKMENKLNRLLFSKYLKDEIVNKVKVTEEHANNYYDKNRSEWPGEFNNVKASVIAKLRKKLMYERRDNLIKDFRNKFDIQYNEELLEELAEQFTDEKNK